MEPTDSKKRGEVTRSFPHLPGKFIGRRDELEELYGILRESVRSSQPKHVLIHGVAGIGKTRLVHEFLNLIEPERKGIEVVRLRLAHEIRSESGRFVAELMAAVWPSQGMTNSERRSRIEVELQEVCDPGERGARCGQIFQILGLRRDDEVGGEPSEFKRESTLGLLSNVLAKRSKAGIIVLFIDGEQWVPKELRRHLESFLNGLNSHPVLVVRTSRESLAGESTILTHEMELKGLGESEALRMCWSLMDGVENLDEHVCSVLLERSACNPGLLEDLVALLLQQGIIVQSHRGGYRCIGSRMDQASLPTTIGESSEARMNALQSRERRILEIASVFGGRFWSGGVEALMRLDEEENGEDWWTLETCRKRFRKVALDLQARGLIDFTPNTEIPNEAEFTFRRGADAVYLSGGIGVKRRQRYQRVGGRWLLAKVGRGGDGTLQGLAAELLGSGGALEEAGGAWVHAGRAARDSNDHRESIRYLERGLGFLNREFADAGIHALQMMIQSQIVLGQLDGASKRARESLDLASALGRHEIAVQTLVSAATVHRLRGEFKTAEHYLSGAREMCGSLQMQKQESAGQSVEALIEEEWGRILLESGGKEAFLLGQEAFERVVELRREVSEPRYLARALRNLGRVCFERDLQQLALESFQEALAISREAGDSIGEASALLGLGNVALEQGVLENALEHGEKGIEAAIRGGGQIQRFMLLNMQGEVELTQGDFQSASRTLREALQASERTGMRRLKAEVLLNLALLEFARGNSIEASEILESAISLAEALESRPLRVRALLVAGRIQLGEDSKKALGTLNRGIALAHSMGGERLSKRLEKLKEMVEG